MNGFERMAKQMLGVDFEKIKEYALGFKDHYEGKVKSDEERFVALEARLRDLEEHCGLAGHVSVTAEPAQIAAPEKSVNE